MTDGSLCQVQIEAATIMIRFDADEVSLTFGLSLCEPNRRQCRRGSSRVLPTRSKPGDVLLIINSQSQAQLGRMVLDMADVVDVQLGSGK